MTRALAAAYEVAVNSTMVTTVLAFKLPRERGQWILPLALTFHFGFLAIDLAFLGSNQLTIPDAVRAPRAAHRARVRVLTGPGRRIAVEPRQRRFVVRALRSLFFVLTAASACFIDSGVKKSVRLVGRVFTVIFALLFVVAEVMELVS